MRPNRGVTNRQRGRVRKLWLVLLVITLPLSSAQAVSRWGCLGMGLAEVWVPGLGYALTRQWDKALILGGTRWVASEQAYQAYESPYYQADRDAIYHRIEKEDSAIGKEETQIYLNRETWNADFYGSLNFNLLMTTWGDLFQHECEPNTQTYQWMAAPFRFDHFYRKWTFWAPISFLLLNYGFLYDYAAEQNDTQVSYYLSRGLTEDDIRRDSFPKYYMVGVGEEMFFRGTVQHFFFEVLRYDLRYPPSIARHLSIAAASAVFAAGHDGSGFTANALTAFMFGLYQGYVYHPSVDEFDLTTAIAVHAWWDILVTYTILKSARFNESQAHVQVPLVSVAFRF
jgi:hypothetical protein